MIARVASPAAIRPGTPMEIRLGRRPAERAARPLERLSFRAALDMQVVVARQEGRLVLQPLRIAVDDTPLRISGRVGASLYFSARAAGVPAKAVEAYIRTLSGQMSLGRDVAADDRFDIVVSHRRTANGEAESGRLLYAGLDRAAGRDVQLLPWTVDGQTRWYEASGVGRTTGSMSQPVAGRITSGFGMRRHPILRFARMHRGVDFAAGYGQPIYAATAGQVVRTGWAGGYGKQVRIAHDGGLLTSYSHMSRIVAQRGSPVRQGQVIGYVGSTGLSTGPHLHYELYRNGVAINPLSVRFVTRSLLEGAELQAFQARLREMTALKTGRPE
jgi:murein DD-endopeptidase MepM/ murein hydrolase activator NlpD